MTFLLIFLILVYLFPGVFRTIILLLLGMVLLGALVGPAKAQDPYASDQQALLLQEVNSYVEDAKLLYFASSCEVWPHNENLSAARNGWLAVTTVLQGRASHLFVELRMKTTSKLTMDDFSKMTETSYNDGVARKASEGCSYFLDHPENVANVREYVRYHLAHDR